MAVPREFCTANYAQAGKLLSPGHGLPRKRKHCNSPVLMHLRARLRGGHGGVLRGERGVFCGRLHSFYGSGLWMGCTGLKIRHL